MTIATQSQTAIAPRLLSPGPSIEASQLEALTPAEWHVLSERFIEHRVAPLAHWCHRQRAGEAIPVSILDRWAEARRDCTIVALRQQQRLAEISGALAQAGLDYMALKGAYLSTFAYPEPALRPMRDLDFVLKGKPGTLAAWELLLSLGYRPLEDAPANLSGHLEENHQLPVLISPDEDVAVELHHRLFHDGEKDPAFEEDFWARGRSRDLFGHRVRFPGTEWLALHLIVHAIVDHRLDSGPNIIADLAFLDRADAIDWARVAALASDFDAGDALRLAKGLLAQGWGIGVCEPDLPLATAWHLMLSPTEQVKSLRHRNRLARLGGKRLLRKILPASRVLEDRYGSAGPTGRVGHYARHFRRLLTQRLPTLAERQEKPLVAAMERLDDWLETGTAP